jgi:hypothetical protein
MISFSLISFCLVSLFSIAGLFPISSSTAYLSSFLFEPTHLPASLLTCPLASRRELGVVMLLYGLQQNHSNQVYVIKINDLSRGKMIAFSRELDLKLTLLQFEEERFKKKIHILFDVPLSCFFFHHST